MKNCTSRRNTDQIFVMWQKLWDYLQTETLKVVDWAKCGEHAVSVVPTLMWAAGAAAVAYSLLTALFSRFLFRRVPFWEILLQYMLFIWMVIYSLHFWAVLVKVIKVVVEYCYHEADLTTSQEEIEGRELMQQWMVWMFSVAPLAVYFHNRPRHRAAPYMIWITTTPWHRREMGPYGYYLNRPLSSLQPTLDGSQPPLRRAFSDSKIIITEQHKKKRYSKSV